MSFKLIDAAGVFRLRESWKQQLLRSVSLSCKIGNFMSFTSKLNKELFDQFDYDNISVTGLVRSLLNNSFNLKD